MIRLLTDFKGDMSLESIGATVFSYWHYHFMQSFLKAYTLKGERGQTWKNEGEPFWSSKTRFSLIDNYGFTYFYLRLV